jgi:nucleoside-diphosphate-sugar epimerase
LADGVTSLVADRRDPAALAKVITGARMDWDLVVDCIGYRAEDAAQDLAFCCDRAPHLVFISTDFVFDPTCRRFPQAEEADRYATEGYGGDKRRAELVFLAAGAGPLAWTILRPCHIYGPGSLLGCLPRHGRDPELIGRLQRGEPLALVGGGHFLQQPLFAPDLAELILSCAGSHQARGRIFVAAGPEIVESREYYRLIAEELGVKLTVAEIPVDQHLTEHPEAAPFLCHRIYSLERLHAAGLRVPATPLAEGLRRHVASRLA